MFYSCRCPAPVAKLLSLHTEFGVLRSTAVKELWNVALKYSMPGIPSFSHCNSAKYCYKWAQNPSLIHWQDREKLQCWGLLVCLSDGCLWWPVWTWSSAKSKSWTSSLLLPPPSCVTGPAQEQLLLPLPVSTALHHSPSKSFLCVCVCGVHSERSHTQSFGSKWAKNACHERHTKNPSWSAHRKQSAESQRNREMLPHWCTAKHHDSV